MQALFLCPTREKSLLSPYIARTRCLGSPSAASLACRFVLVAVGVDPAHQLGAAEAPGAPEFEGRDVAVLGKTIDRPLAGPEVGGNFVERENFPVGIGHVVASPPVGYSWPSLANSCAHSKRCGHASPLALVRTTGHKRMRVVRLAAVGYVQECLSGTGWPSTWVSSEIAGIHAGIVANISVHVLSKTSR